MKTYSKKSEVTELLENLVEAGIFSTNGNEYWPAGTYHLAHGEYSQPDYRAARYADGWGVSKESYYHQGTFGAPTGRSRIDLEELEAELYYANNRDARYA